MKSTPALLLLLAALASYLPCPAPADEADEPEYEGSAAASSPTAYQEAISHIFQKALQEQHLLVLSKSTVEDQRLTENSVQTRSAGYVESYTVTTNSVSAGVLRVRARVRVRPIKDNLLAFFRSAEFAEKFGRTPVAINPEVDFPGKDAQWLRTYIESHLLDYPFDGVREARNLGDGIMIHAQVRGEKNPGLVVYDKKVSSVSLAVSLKVLEPLGGRTIAAVAPRMCEDIMVADAGLTAFDKALTTLVENGCDARHGNMLDELLEKLALRHMFDRNLGASFTVRVSKGTVTDAGIIRDNIAEKLKGRIRSHLVLADEAGSSIHFLTEPRVGEHFPPIVESLSYDVTEKTGNLLVVKPRPPPHPQHVQLQLIGGSHEEANQLAAGLGKGLAVPLRELLVTSDAGGAHVRFEADAGMNLQRMDGYINEMGWKISANSEGVRELRRPPPPPGQPKSQTAHAALSAQQYFGIALLVAALVLLFFLFARRKTP